MKKDLEFHLEENVRALGVRVICALVEDLDNSSTPPALEAERSRFIERFQATLNENILRTDPSLCGFRELHEKVGRSNRRYPSSPEALIQLFISRGIVPQINSVVDIYNYISLDTRLALGAHDVEHIEGNVTLRLTNGSESFVPLGSNVAESINAGEYCYIDDSNEVLCRLEHKQVEKTKVTTNTQSCFFIIQGNEKTLPETLQEALERLSHLLFKHCSGKVLKVWSHV